MVKLFVLASTNKLQKYNYLFNVTNFYLKPFNTDQTQTKKYFKSGSFLTKQSYICNN